MTATPTLESFLARWEASGASERANYQLFLSELCDQLGVERPEPSQPDEALNRYVFEKAVTFAHGDGSTSHGRIDLYRRGCFVLEAKQGSLAEAPAARVGHGRRKTAGWDEAMMKARGQAESYARALPASEGWPPFLLVVDVGFSIEVYADFSGLGKTYTPYPDPASHRLFLPDLARPEVRERLHAIWTDPVSLDPARRSARVTRAVADTLASLARSLEASGHAPEAIFGFLMRAIFTMFAEDVKLLPEGSFTKLLERMEGNPSVFAKMLGALWNTMAQGGFSPVLETDVLRFNGGLFETCEALPLTAEQIHILSEAARHDWRDVEPAIFGTLVERALDAHERHKLGAHYTPRAYVERLVLPTVIDPLREDWNAAKVEALTLRQSGKDAAAVAALRAFHRRLCAVRVLDPACGSGNFLYVTLEHMKRLEAEVLDALAALGDTQGGLELEGVTVSPLQFLGLEINPRAAAIADLVLWIGYLQWHLRTHGNAHPKEPVIERFHSIEWRDALIAHGGTAAVTDSDGTPKMRWDGRTFKTHPVTGEQVPDEAAQVPVEAYLDVRRAVWPEADFIVGNPPFIGASTMRQSLGDGYVEAVRGAYPELPESIDFVMYWWHLAARATVEKRARRFGFITTNSLRQTFNRRAITPHMDAGLRLAFAIPDHPWVDSADGAAVRIAMTVGTMDEGAGLLLRSRSEIATDSDEIRVAFEEFGGEVHADLTVGADVTGVVILQANDLLTFRGHELGSSGFLVESAKDFFALTGFGGDEASSEETAEHALRSSGVEAARSKFLRIYRNGKDLNDRPRGVVVIDAFGVESEDLKARAPEIYQWLSLYVRPDRETNRDERLRREWWLHRRSREDLRLALANLPRYIATTETSKHRMFQFLDASICPDNMLVCMALSDAFHLGVLSSRVHVTWALAAGGTLEDRPRYNKTLCFDPFPFPACTTEQEDRIRQIAERLDAHRKRQQELHADLTMTGMYNVLDALREGRALNPKEKAIHEKGLVSILRELHDELDAAVFAAYGWDISLSDEQILERLVALNAQRAAEEAQGLVRWLRPSFQNPSAQMAAGQADLALPDSPSDKKQKVAKTPWPSTTREQIAALRAALSQAGSGTTAEALAKRFQGARAGQVGLLLEAMAALGQVRESEGRYAA
jgi:hypothetical protein